VADTRDWGFCEELDDLLWHPEKSLQQGPLAYFTFFWWIHHVHQLLGGFSEVLQLLLPPLLLLAQRLDLPKAVGELFFSVGDYLLQPLDVICTAIQHIPHVSKQLFFICYDFPKLCGEGIFRIHDKLLSGSTRGKQGLTLVRLLLFLELLLEIAQIVLKKPCLSSLFLLQHVKLSLKIAVLRLLVGYAFFHGSKLLVTTHNCFQFLRLLLRVRDHVLYKGEDYDKQLDNVYKQKSDHVIPWQNRTTPCRPS
jgi:hypothetical protein